MLNTRRRISRATALRAIRDFESSRGRQATEVVSAWRHPAAIAQADALVATVAPGLARWSADLLSIDADGSWRLIKLVRRAGTAPVDLPEEDYRTGRALGTFYWLYVVGLSAVGEPEIRRIPDAMSLPWVLHRPATPERDLGRFHTGATSAVYRLGVAALDLAA